jgi:hypothetical protein
LGWKYVFEFFEHVLLALHAGFDLLRAVDELLLELLLEVVLGLLPDLEGAVEFGDDVGLLAGELYFLGELRATMVLP